MTNKKLQQKSTEKLLEVISSKLDRIFYALALNAVKGENQKSQILDLSNLGYKPKEIAAILRTTPNTVSVTLSHSRKSPKKDKLNVENEERH